VRATQMTTEPDYFVRLKDIESGPSKLFLIIAIAVAVDLVAGAALVLIGRRKSLSTKARDTAQALASFRDRFLPPRSPRHGSEEARGSAPARQHRSILEYCA
jgi:hypothetical protein